MSPKTKQSLKDIAIGAAATAMVLTFPKVSLIISLVVIAWIVIPVAVRAYNETRG